MVVYYYDAAWGVNVSIKELKKRFGNDENFLEMISDFDTLSITDYLAEKFSADCFHIPHDYVEQNNFVKCEQKVSATLDDDDSENDDSENDGEWFFIGKKVTCCNNDTSPYKRFEFLTKKTLDDAYNETVEIVRNAGFNVDDITYGTISNDCNCCT